jgi:thymidylate synthase
MFTRKFKGINSFLVGAAQLLRQEAVERTTRGSVCYELPYPVMIEIEHPTARLVTISDRKWNHVLPYVESLWLASGRNDINMIAHYVKKMVEYSDDSKTMRAGYGPRFRHFTGVKEDYNCGYRHERPGVEDLTPVEIDQFVYIEEAFQRDPFTRQGIISIGDPAKDCFENGCLKKTKDFPCTRDIQLIRNGNKLDLIVHMRSNDFIWGAGGVNIFNFTFLQEYFAQILSLEVGRYFHIINNFHYYKELSEMVEKLSDTSVYPDEPYLYKKSFKNLKEFDERLLAFQGYELRLREEQKVDIVDFGDDFFNDWAKVLYQFNSVNASSIKYVHPVLQQIAHQKLNKRKSIQLNKQQLNSALSGSPGEPVFWRQYI